MTKQTTPVTLAVIDPTERKRLERFAANMETVQLQGESSDVMGILVYEMGESAVEDMPHILKALETGQAEDVYLVGSEPDPELLISAMRGGVREFLPYPLTENDFRAALARTIRRQSCHDSEGARGSIITVMGCKPGNGATTVAVNLAHMFQKSGGAIGTALMDMRQPRGETALILDQEFRYTWGDVAEDIDRLDETYLHSMMAQREDGLSILAAPVNYGRPESSTLGLIFDQMRQSFSRIVVDTAWHESDPCPKEIELAETIVLLMEMTLPCMARVKRMVETIRAQDPDAASRIRLCAFRTAKNLGISVQEAEEVLEMKVTWEIADDYSAAVNAINQGIPLVEAAPKSAASKGLLKIADELGPKTSDGECKSFSLRRLFSRKAKNDARGGGKSKKSAEVMGALS